MNKKTKTIVNTIVVVAVLTAVIILGKITSKLPKNPVGFTGNSAGNLYNKGLFVEDDKNIYFANLYDNGCLYRMDKNLGNIRKLSKDSVHYLNLDNGSDFLYYSRVNYLNNTLGGTGFDLATAGIYRYKIKNGSLTQFYRNTAGTVLLFGNHLFFQTHGDDGDFDLSGICVTTNKPKISPYSTGYFVPVSTRDNLIFYSGVEENHCLYTFDVSSKETTLYADVDAYQPIATKDGVYFLSLSDNYSLCFLPNGETTPRILSDARIFTYNLSADGKTIYYQVDKENSRICRFDPETGTETTLLTGDFCNLNTVSDYLFFTDYKEITCYCYNGKTGDLNIFSPQSDSSK